MAGKGARTRERILDATHLLTLDQGFSATSVDQILARTQLTKGAFFYHFKSKAELAHALVRRYADNEERFLAEWVARAERLSRDPRQQLLLVVGFAEEAFAELDPPHPGCLFGSFCYQNGLLDEAVLELMSDAMLAWRRVLLAKLEDAARSHPLPEEVDLEAVADMFLTVFEGGFVMARLLDDAGIVARQLRNYRDYLERLFASP